MARLTPTQQRKEIEMTTVSKTPAHEAAAAAFEAATARLDTARRAEQQALAAVGSARHNQAISAANAQPAEIAALASTLRDAEVVLAHRIRAREAAAAEQSRANASLEQHVVEFFHRRHAALKQEGADLAYEADAALAEARKKLAAVDELVPKFQELLAEFQASGFTSAHLPICRPAANFRIEISDGHPLARRTFPSIARALGYGAPPVRKPEAA